MKRGTSRVHKPQSISGILALFLMLVLAIAALVYVSNSRAKDGDVITYEQCEHSEGSQIQLSYPSVCVTREGQRFVNPTDRHSCGRYGWSSHPQTCE